MRLTPFNPLDKRNLGASVARQLLECPVEQLPPAPFLGAGVYAIYYTGEYLPYAPYEPLATHNAEPGTAVPIYVGKAVPQGARVGGFGLDRPPGNDLSSRLREHSKTIQSVPNLDLRDFHCRYLVVDDIWIPLAENVLIEMFQPLWNTTIFGFGNHSPGSGRGGQQRSRWDVLHSGRAWADTLPSNSQSEAEIIQLIAPALAARPTNQ